MDIRLNAHCGCGFNFGTDGIDGVSSVEQDRLLALFQSDGVKGFEMIGNAAREHCATQGHTIEIHGDFRKPLHVFQNKT